MKRIGALLASVALVVAALWIRGRLDGGGGDEIGSFSRVTCATEVYRACEVLSEAHPELTVTTEDAGDTAARLAELAPGGDPEFDVWLTATPYSELARETARSGAGANSLGPASAPLGHARLGFWVDQSRAPTLESHCGGQVGWGCLLDAAPKRWEAIGGDPAWGPVKPHISEPSGAAGLLALGNAATAIAGPGADALAIEENSGFVSAITGLSRARVKQTLGSGAALNRMLAAGPAEVDIVIALESEGARFGDAATTRARLIYPSPVAAAVVYAVPRAGEGKGLENLMELMEEQAAEALRSTGWRPGAGPPVEGLPTLGGLLSIKNLWEEIR